MDPLAQLAVIWASVLIAALLARHTRLTPVLYFLAAGSVLVNVGLLPEEAHPFVRSFAEIGIIVIMFALGFEEQASHFLRSIRRSWGIALFGALAPFATAYWLAEFFWDDYRVSLMCALAMTATAVSLTMVTLRGEGLHTSKAATRIMTSAILDDIASLALVALLIPLAAGGDAPTLGEAMLILLKAIAFFAVVGIAGIWLLPHPLAGWVAKIPLISHFGIRHLLQFEDGAYTTLIMLLFALTMGLLAHAFGFHPAVGAYMAGLILREEYFAGGNPNSGYRATQRVSTASHFPGSARCSLFCSAAKSSSIGTSLLP